MDGAAVAGLAGAIIGAGVSGLSAWLTQRVQVRRDETRRRFDERDRWMLERRAVFREVHAAADAWAYLLRRTAAGSPADGGERDVPGEDLATVERRFHGLVYEVAMLCGADVSGAVEDLEATFLLATNRLGTTTQYGAGAAESAVRAARAEWRNGDLPALRERRAHLLRAMRHELGVD